MAAVWRRTCGLVFFVVRDGQLLSGGCGVAFDQAPDGVAAERGTAWSGEDRVVGMAAALGEIGPQNGDGVAGQRRGTVLPALASATDVGAGAQVDISPAQSDQLGDPQPGLHRNDEQGVVAPADRARAVRAGQQGVDLRRGEEADDGTLARLVGMAKHALDERGVLGVA